MKGDGWKPLFLFGFDSERKKMTSSDGRSSLMPVFGIAHQYYIYTHIYGSFCPVSEPVGSSFHTRLL